MKKYAEIKNDINIQNHKSAEPDEVKESDSIKKDIKIQDEIEKENQGDAIQTETAGEEVQSHDGLFLIVKNQSGSERNKHMLIEGKEIIVGSGAECDVLVFDEYVSAKHFAVKLENGKIQVRDLNSTNGLYLKIDNPLEIKKNQSLLAGISLFSLKEESNE